MQKTKFLYAVAVLLLAASISFYVTAQSESEYSEGETILVVPFSKYNFFAPPKMLHDLRGNGTLNSDSLCTEYFTAFYSAIQELDCGFIFQTPRKEDAIRWINSTRLESINGKDQLNLAESQGLREMEWSTDFILFINHYEVEGRIEDKQPGHTVHYDLINRDLKRIKAGAVTGTLFQSRISDKEARRRMILKSLAERLCKKLD